MPHIMFLAAVLILLASLLLLMFVIAITGRAAKEGYEGDITVHRGFGTTFIVITIILVIIIEFGARFVLTPTNLKSPLFMFVHLPAAVTFLTTALVMRLRITGLRAPALHHALAYRVFFPSAAIAIGTGLYLLATASFGG